MKIIIWHVGEMLAGVGNAVIPMIDKMAASQGYTSSKVSSGDILRKTLERLQVARNFGWVAHGQLFLNILHEILTIWNIPFNEGNLLRLRQAILNKSAFGDGNVDVCGVNLQKLHIVMASDDAFGEYTTANLLCARAVAQKEDIVHVDKLRTLADENRARSTSNSVVLYTTASFAVRHQRALNRKRESEESVSVDEFRRQNEAATEIYIPQIGSRADWKIVNEGTLEELEAKVREFWGAQVRPILEGESIGLEIT